MLEVASYAIDGDANFDADMASETAEMQLQLAGSYEKAGEGSLAEMHVAIEGYSSDDGRIELVVTGYLEDENAYMTMDGDKWYRTDLTASPSGVLQATNPNMSQFMPESFMMQIDMARMIQVIAEDEESIEFELYMERDFYFLQKVSEAEQELGKEYDEFSTMEKKEVEMSVDMNVRYGRTRYFYSVDKRTGLLQEFGSTYAVDASSPSEKMTMSGEMWFRFSDYGQDFVIQVPQEARDAEYVPPGTSFDL